MARPKNSDSAQTRRRLLAAAAEAFGTQGYHRARLEDIAAAAGIRRPSLLYHFKTKEALYVETLNAGAADLLQTLAGAIPKDDASPMARFDAFFEAFATFAADRRADVAMFARELLDPTPAGETHLASFARVMDNVDKLMASVLGPKMPAAFPLRVVLVHLFAGVALRIAAAGTHQDDPVWGKLADLRTAMRTLLEATQ